MKYAPIEGVRRIPISKDSDKSGDICAFRKVKRVIGKDISVDIKEIVLLLNILFHLFGL